MSSTTKNPYETRRKSAHDELMPLMRSMVEDAKEELRAEMKNRLAVAAITPVIEAVSAVSAVSSSSSSSNSDAVVNALESINRSIVTMQDNVTKAIIDGCSEIATSRMTAEDIKPLCDPLLAMVQHVRKTAENTKNILHVQKRLREDFNDLFEDAADTLAATKKHVPAPQGPEGPQSPVGPGLRESMILDKSAFARDDFYQ